MQTGPWRIELFGVLTARQGDLTISRFRTQKTASLLAYLAHFRDRSHPREHLIEILWPGAEPAHGKMSLRTALSSIRRQFEPPGVPFGTIITTGQTVVQLNSSAVSTDVADFLECLKAASSAKSTQETLGLLQAAVDLYRGDLLTGLYDEWIVAERRRMFEAYLGALRKLTRFHAAKRDYESAVRTAQKTMDADPLREESHRDLMRLYAAMGRPSAAMAQFADLEGLLRANEGRTPSTATRALVLELGSAANSAPATVTVKAIRNDESQMQEKDVITATRAPRRPALPLTLSRFFGRTAELATLTEALAPNGHNGANRLFTLTGPGGVGKTRTAIETARSLQDAYAGRVWYVPLADSFSVDQITSAIADSLSIKKSGASSVIEEVAAALQPESSLIVLDNFEQVAETGPSVVSALLARAGPLKALVTSRRRLALDGEREYPLSPLTVPAGEIDLQALLQIPSIQLFVDRAQAVRPDFQLTVRNAQAVSEVCRILEGIPLAIELAAARSQVLTPARMAEKLVERFKVLSAIREDRVARHRSLWAAIDWSYQLLSPELQRFFCALSVFRGGCTADAAEKICDEPRALGYLSALRAHSLIATMEAGDEMRFVMLETLREFATEQLDAEAAGYRERHADFFGSVAQEARPYLEGAKQAEWLSRLDVEYANIRESLGNMIDRGKGTAALRTATALWRFWWIRGQTEEATLWLEQSLALANDPAPLDHADAVQGLGNLAWRKGENESAVALFKEAQILREAAGDRLKAAESLGSIGNPCRQLNRIDEAQAAYEQSLAIFRELNDANGAATSLLNLATVCEDKHDYEGAYRKYLESLQIYRDIGDLHSECVNLSNLGNNCITRSCANEARSFLKKCLQIGLSLNDYPIIGEVLAVSAKLALLEDAPGTAAELIGAAEAYHQRYQLPIRGRFRQEVDHTSASARELLGKSQFESAREAGRDLSTDAVIELALG